MSESKVRFCVRCGSAVIELEKFGAVRPVCPACGWIYFADPKVAAAGLVEQGNKILLVRRLNEPQRGLWSLPAGYVDAGEDPARAAERECLEETGLVARVTGLLDVLSGAEFKGGADIVIVYRMEVTGGALAAGDDADQAAFFERGALPELAFLATRKIISAGE